MGLFDRFKKMMKKSESTEDIVATEDSVEAEEALYQKRKLMEELESRKRPRHHPRRRTMSGTSRSQMRPPSRNP